ncbi:MAG TPA: 30S ribosomal protein S6 [Solirubrobacteraceae bacterium]|jgi:small subunit ribosomal protein S6|nr:30S ribosomal protein S6 [Solirubrobacteraceae bacterium]
MARSAPIYDLVLLLDAQADPSVREKILADVKDAIAAQGELLLHDEWGDRALTFPIDHKTDAEYHLLQFHVGDTELLHGLNRTLHITDGVVRFRIVKLKPGTPKAPDMTPGHRPATGEEPHGEEPQAEATGESEEHVEDESPEETSAEAEIAEEAEIVAESPVAAE